MLASILSDVAAGEPTRKAIVAHGGDTKGFYALIGCDADVGKRYAHAKLCGLERLADEIIEIADDGSGDVETRTNAQGEEYEAQNTEFTARSRLRVDSRKWLLSKLVPKRYGDRIDLGSDPDRPLITKVVREIVRTPDQNG